MAELKFIPKSDSEYVEFYSEAIKNDNSVFEQQRKFINSQIKASRELFLNLFGKGELFKKKAREYLKNRGLV